MDLWLDGWMDGWMYSLKHESLPTEDFFSPVCLPHLFSDVLSQLSQDLIKDNELANQSLGVVT